MPKTTTLTVEERRERKRAMDEKYRQEERPEIDAAIEAGYCHTGTHITAVPLIAVMKTIYWRWRKLDEHRRQMQILEERRAEVAAANRKWERKLERLRNPDREGSVTCGRCARKMQHRTHCWKCGWKPGEPVRRQEQVFLRLNVTEN